MPAPVIKLSGHQVRGHGAYPARDLRNPAGVPWGAGCPESQRIRLLLVASARVAPLLLGRRLPPRRPGRQGPWRRQG